MRRGPGRKFAKGTTGNPAGSSKRSREMGAVSRLTNEQLSEVAALMLKGDLPALVELSHSASAPVLQVWMARLVEKSLESGDAGTFRTLMDRLLGKPKETTTLVGPDGGPMVARMETDTEKLERIEALRRAREEVGRG